MAYKIDGQAEALRLLRRLQKFNGDRERPIGSARLVNATLRAMNGWPEKERLRFSRVLSDWIVSATLGFCEDIEEYEDGLFAQAVRKVRTVQADIDSKLLH